MSNTQLKKNIYCIEGLSLRQVAKGELQQFTQFVANIYNSSTKNHWSKLNLDNIQKMVEEDKLHYPSGLYFQLIDEKQRLAGTCKITKHTGKFKFPIEEIFNIDIQKQCQSMGLKAKEVWHFGRLAIDRSITKTNSLKALNTLLYYSLSVVARYPANLLVAECDADVCRKLELIGIKSLRVGQPVDYVGSPTYPIFVPAENLQNYLQQVKQIFS